MTAVLQSALTLSWIILMPPLIIGTICKTKARLQNRQGAPLWQPFPDILKLIRKDGAVSDTASWVFNFAASLLMGVAVFLAVSAPWVAPKQVAISCDLFLFFYLLTMFRFCTLLFSLDTSSPFGTFAASREAALSILVEPAAVLGLAALAIQAHSLDLNIIFGDYSKHGSILWLLSGSGLLLASLVDMSRMPVDDPTTHLELTMVHEAMILEASGKILAILQYSNWLKFAVLLGLSCQCFLHAFPIVHSTNIYFLAATNLLALLGLSAVLGVFESVTVKLHWRKAPEFIAYALTLSLMASITSLARVVL